MFGPRLDGRNGVALRTPTLDDHRLFQRWILDPESTQFWGGRLSDFRPEAAEERHTKEAAEATAILWSIAFENETVGFTGIFGIDWVARDGESGIFIGRHDLYGKGIASEAIRLRTDFAWRELRLRRVHNWISLRNRGSRRANEKAGYHQMGLLERWGFRSGQWYDDWLGEAFSPDFSSATFSPPSKGG